MKITIEIDSENELEKLSTLFKKLAITTVDILPKDKIHIPLTKGDKTIDPNDLLGIWADEPRDLQTIRKAAWSR